MLLDISMASLISMYSLDIPFCMTENLSLEGWYYTISFIWFWLWMNDLILIIKTKINIKLENKYKIKKYFIHVKLNVSLE